MCGKRLVVLAGYVLSFLIGGVVGAVMLRSHCVAVAESKESGSEEKDPLDAALPFSCQVFYSGKFDAAQKDVLRKFWRMPDAVFAPLSEDAPEKFQLDFTEHSNGLGIFDAEYKLVCGQGKASLEVKIDKGDSCQAHKHYEIEVDMARRVFLLADRIAKAKDPRKSSSEMADGTIGLECLIIDGLSGVLSLYEEAALSEYIDGEICAVSGEGVADNVRWGDVQVALLSRLLHSLCRCLDM